MVKNNFNLFGFGERGKKLGVAGLIAMGALSISACNQSASAERAPTTATSEAPAPAKATPSTTETAPAAKNESERLGNEITKEYAAYLESLTPEERADVEKLQSKNIVKMSPEEVTKAFEIPASLVTKDGTLNTLDKEALGVALAARDEALSTLVNAELPPNPELTIPQVTAEISPFYNAAIKGYWFNNNDGVDVPENMVAIAMDSVFAESIKDPTIYGDDHSQFYSPYVIHAIYEKGTANASPVQDNTISSFTYSIKTRDNFPQEASEAVAGVTRKPLDGTSLANIHNVRITTDGNVVIDSPAL